MNSKFLILKYLLLINTILFSFQLTFSQRILTGDDLLDSANLNNAKVVGAYINGNDTMLNIVVQEIVIFPPREFKTEKEKQKYTRLMYNVKKVYPYAQLINVEYNEIETTVASMQSEKEIKKYLKVKEDELMNQFEKELMDLTFSQGRILIKLVDRETGNTTYSVIKEFKGSVSAMFWQSIALMFSSSLKYEYDGEEEDKMIEEIIAMIENGLI